MDQSHTLLDIGFGWGGCNNDNSYNNNDIIMIVILTITTIVTILTTIIVIIIITGIAIRAAEKYSCKGKHK